MLFFTSDLHFYHEKMIRHTQRPFHNVEEMNKALIRKWNDKITFDDEVYILGDFTMKGGDVASAVLYSLKGRKHLIRGNHDHFVDDPQFDQSLFISVHDYLEIAYLNTNFVLFHYPIVDWNGRGRGAVALHGHQHNHSEYNVKNLQNNILRYDVGVDANHMAPVSAKEIIDFLSEMIIIKVPVLFLHREVKNASLCGFAGQLCTNLHVPGSLRAFSKFPGNSLYCLTFYL